MNKPYVKPVVKTLDADQVVEAMGPVSCGSGAPNKPMPVSGDIGPAVGRSGGGLQGLN